MNEGIDQMLGRFQSIDLKDVKESDYRRRTDTKYVFGIKFLPFLFNQLEDDYLILSVNGKKIQDYHTMYYDTPDLKMYTQHHNGKLNRYKVRKRKYLSNNLLFLEIKFKNNQSITSKSRILSPGDMDILTEQDKQFLRDNTCLDPKSLIPQSENEFRRITLMNVDKGERITLDIYLSLKRDSRVYSLDRLVVGEIKKNASRSHSVFENKLQALGIQPCSFSKYCTSIALIDTKIKTNNFKPGIRKFQKINTP